MSLTQIMSSTEGLARTPDRALTARSPFHRGSAVDDDHADDQLGPHAGHHQREEAIGLGLAVGRVFRREPDRVDEAQQVVDVGGGTRRPACSACASSLAPPRATTRTPGPPPRRASIHRLPGPRHADD